jgi:hypothetical protein
MIDTKGAVIVGGQRGWDFLSGCEALDMLTYRPDSQPTVISDTSHDLHLDSRTNCTQ